MIEDSTSVVPSPIARPSTISSMPITKQEKKVLLLPVPYISRHRVEAKQRPPTAHETSAANRAEVLSRLSTASAKMLPRVESVPPYYVSSLAGRSTQLRVDIYSFLFSCGNLSRDILCVMRFK